MSEPAIPKMNPDSEAIYDERISPLMSQVIAICKEHRIPMLATFQLTAEGVRQDEDGPMFCTTYIGTFPDHDKRLDRAYDRIRTVPGFAAFTITTQPKEPTR